MRRPCPCLAMGRRIPGLLAAYSMQPAGDLNLATRHQLRSLDTAALKHLRAARIERAAARDGLQAWHCAVDLGQARTALAERRDRTHQSDRVRMPWALHELRHRADLDDSPGI